MTSPFFYTWTAQSGARSLTVTGGQGVWLEAGGARWLDLASLSYQANLGHGHPRMVEAIKRQAQDLCLAPPWAVFPAKSELAAALLDLAPPGFSKVFFTLGGAEANENALKIARMVTGRYKIVSRYRSYHGATMGALSLTGDYRRPPVEPGLPGVIRVLDRAEDIEEVLELEGPGSVGAVILESFPGANGVLLPPADYWPRIRDACDRHGSLLIADEVLTGFGRTGRGFGFEHHGVVPDMITVAKALTGGYAPLGAVLVRDEIAAHFNAETLYAGLTNYAHPLGCAAALEAMSVYRDDNLFEQAKALGLELEGHLKAIAVASPSAVRDSRCVGLLAALDLSLSAEQWTALETELDRRRILLHLSERRGTAIFAPPLIIDSQTLHSGIQEFGSALAKVCP